MPNTSSTTEDRLDAARLELLRLPLRQPAPSRRRLSRSLGLSLGRAHYLLHALLDKGLLKIRDFQRSDRKPACARVLAPGGLREKPRRTGAFLARKEEEFEALRQALHGDGARAAGHARQGGRP